MKTLFTSLLLAVVGLTLLALAGYRSLSAIVLFQPQIGFLTIALAIVGIFSLVFSYIVLLDSHHSKDDK